MAMFQMIAELSIAEDSLPDYDAMNFDFEQETEMKADDDYTDEDEAGGGDLDEYKEDFMELVDTEN